MNLKLLSFSLLLVMLLSSLSFSATHAVNGSGMSCVPGASNNFSTITSAIALPTVMNGDTIIVCKNGSSGYTENFNISKSLNLYGNESGVVIKSANPQFPTINVTADDVNISNFTIRNTIADSATNPGAGIFVLANDSSIANNVFTNTTSGVQIGWDMLSLSINNTLIHSNSFINGSGGSSSYTVYSVYTYGTENVRVENNNFTNGAVSSSTESNAIHLGSSTQSITIVGNTIHNYTRGVNVDDGSNSFTNFSSNIIQNNTQNDFYFIPNGESNCNFPFSNNIGTGNYNITLVNSSVSGTLNDATLAYLMLCNADNSVINNITISNPNKANGVYLAFTSSSSITNSTLNRTYYGFFLTGSSSNNLTGNTIQNSSQNGIYLISSSNSNTLRDNTVSLTTQQSFYVSSSSNTLINNTATQSSSSGMYITEGENNNLINNTIHSHSSDSAVRILIGSTSLTGNNISNNVRGIHLSGMMNLITNVTITSNTISGNTQQGIYALEDVEASLISSNNISSNAYGIYLDVTNNTNITSNRISGNSVSGIYLVQQNYSSGPRATRNIRVSQNTIENNTYGIHLGFGINETNYIFSNPSIKNNTYGIYLDKINGSTHIYDNTLIHNNSIGIFANSSNTTNVTNNTFNYNGIGVHLYNSTVNNLTSNSIQNSTSSSGAILINSSNKNILSYNTVTNSSGTGIYLLTSHNNTLNGDSSSNPEATTFGIYVFNSNSNNITNVTLFNNTNHAISLAGSSDNNLINASTAYNNSKAGFAIAGTSATSNTFKDNTAYNHPTANAFSAFYFDTVVNSTNITNNTAYDTYRGFLFASSNITIFTQNNITNATSIALQLGSGTNLLNFSGNNGIYSIPAGEEYVHIDSSGDSQFSTNNFNITTDNLNFQVVNSTDISLNVTNLSTFNTITTITNYSLDSSQVVQSQQGNYFAVGIRNLSSDGSASIKLFYNSSDNSSTNLGIGSTSTVGTWTYYNSTINTSEKSLVPQTSITSFSLFAPIGFNESTSTTISSSSDESPSKKSFSVDYQLDGDVLSADAGTDDVKITLISTTSGYSQIINSDDGKESFNIPSSGTYKLILSKSGYFTQTITLVLDLDLDEPTVVEEVVEQEDDQQDNTQDSSEQQDTQEEDSSLAQDALNAITLAQEQINNAESQGKITSQAKLRLQRAQEEFDKGNYELAIELAEQAINLIKEPQAIEDTQNNEVDEPTKQEETQENNTLLIALIVLAVLLVGGYLFSRMRNK